MAVLNDPTTFVFDTVEFSNRLSFTWADNETDADYLDHGLVEVWKSPDGIAWDLITSVEPGTEAYSDSEGLSPLTTYYYRLINTCDPEHSDSGPVDNNEDTLDVDIVYVSIGNSPDVYMLDRSKYEWYGNTNVGNRIAGIISPGDIVIGEKSGGNYTYIPFDGPVVFKGTSGLIAGEISALENTTPITISASNTFYQVVTFDTNGPSKGATPDHTNDHITILTAGLYFISVSATVDSVSGAASKFHMAGYKNNGATVLGAVHCHRNIAGGGGVSGVVSMSGLVDLAVNDTVEIWISNETNTQNYIIADITLSLFHIGG